MVLVGVVVVVVIVIVIVVVVVVVVVLIVEIENMLKPIDQSVLTNLSLLVDCSSLELLASG